MHGLGKQSLQLFEEMKRCGCNPEASFESIFYLKKSICKDESFYSYSGFICDILLPLTCDFRDIRYKRKMGDLSGKSHACSYVISYFPWLVNLEIFVIKEKWGICLVNLMPVGVTVAHGNFFEAEITYTVSTQGLFSFYFYFVYDDW